MRSEGRWHRVGGSGALAAGLAFVVACSSTPGAECVPGDRDPSCGRGAPVTGADGAADAVSAIDASARDACVMLTDSGATRGCTSGANGPGDKDEGGGLDAAAPPDVAVDAHDLGFMQPCDSNAQCASGLCYDFVVKGYFCTMACDATTFCPPPSPGCSGMGYCRAPG